MSQNEWIVLLCGLGTFLIRWLPLRGQARAREAAAAGGLQRYLRGIGPAAIAALLAVSFWPLAMQHADTTRLMVILAALVVLWISKRCFGGIAGPTLLAAVCYGALHAWLGLTPI